MSNEAHLNNLIQGIQFRDPRLYDVLRGLIDNISAINQELFPTTTISQITPGTQQVIPPDVITFNYNIRPTYLNLTWESPDTNQSFSYEIRKGTSGWDTASRILVTSTLSAQLEPISTGSHTYYIKAISSSGGYSVNALPLEVIIPSIGTFSISAQVIDNNVLLSWNEPYSPFQIDYYQLKRGSTILGTTRGTFNVVFETTAGTYTYTITPYDIAGNSGPASSVNAVVNQPPDYVLKKNWISDLSGTKTNTVLDIDRLICNVYTTETWQSHFINRGWDSPQDQIDAGYPIFIQPGYRTGAYEEVFDYGTTISNTIVSLTWNTNLIVGSGHTITSQIRTSTTSGSGPWSAYEDGPTVFVASMRWLEVKFTFTAID